MPSSALHDLTSKLSGLEFKSVLRTAALAVVAGAGLLAVSIHGLLRWTGQVPDSLVIMAGAQVVVLIAFASIYLLLSERFANRPDSIVEVFWTPVIAGASLLLVGYFVSRFGQNENVTRLMGTSAVGFDLNTGRPLALASVMKMNVLSWLTAIFCFILLLRLRNLAMIKRTVGSQRSWNWMIIAMIIAAATTFMKSPRYELNLYQSVALVPAVGLMAVNAFRTAWIVSLSFRRKLVVIGLSVAILAILLSVGVMDQSLAVPHEMMPGSYSLLRHYSYPLAIFSNLAIVFGIIYCTTTILTVLFHLPTTSAYQQKVHEVAAIHSLTDLVGQVFDPKALFDTIVAAPISAGLADAAWLTLSDPPADANHKAVATHRISTARIDRMVDIDALASEANEAGEPLLIAHALADHRVSARSGEGIGSILVVPLSARGEVLGSLFATKEVSRGFEPEDVEALRVYGDQAALALDHAHLFEERIEKERMARELDIAREVQTKLLPNRIPSLPGLAISAGSVPAQEVGGDYYDFMMLDESRLAFIVADVSGKGTSAAFYMAAMQGIFKALSRVSAGPRDFVIAANGALSSLLERNIFVSVIYGVIDLRAETITVARAGHCPPAISTLSGDAAYWRLHGLGLGLDVKGDIFAGAIIEDTRPLRPGDVLLFYTDGVTESRHSNGSEYGYDRLLEFVRKNRHEEADGIRALLLADLNEFVDYGSYGDDTTIVVVKWHGNH